MKIQVLQVSSKGRSTFVQKILVFYAKCGEMFQKLQVLHVSSKSGSIFVKNHCFLQRNGDFEGGGVREPTNTGTHPRINGLGVGRGGSLEGWEVVVVGEEEGGSN